LKPDGRDHLHPRQVLHQEVATRLRQRIVEGHIAPGAKLNERELSESLKVSRTPLREAIKMLAAEGLVELLPNRGAVALQLSEQDVADTFEVIAGSKASPGELAAQRITDDELAELRRCTTRCWPRTPGATCSTYYRINAQIHSLINPRARNAVLTQTWRTVNARLQSLRFRSNLERRQVAARGEGARAHGRAAAARDAPACER
jgi:DNA-binding GntR family transcriptional regulator